MPGSVADLKVLDMTEVETTLKQWLDEEADVRARMATSGVADRSQLAALSGLDFLRSILNGDLPAAPMAVTLDYLLIGCERGRAVFQGTPKREHYNPSGSVHGGYFSTLLDSALGCAVHTCLEPGQGYATIELKVTLLRALTDRTGPVRADARVISVGRRLGTAEARLTDPAGRLYAHATTSCMIFPLNERPAA